MKVKLNPMFEQLSGQMGAMVFRKLRGETIVSRKAFVSAEPTVDQAAHRERFKQAVAYGKSALADPTARARYEAAAKEKDMPVFALTIADFFHAPTLDTLDLSAYHGQVDDLITISARDDFGVVAVVVSIADQAGTIQESGNAVETIAGSGRWVYTAKANMDEGTTLTVSAVATDHPGGTVVKTQTKSI